jgi:hypothetical protein
LGAKRPISLERGGTPGRFAPTIQRLSDHVAGEARRLAAEVTTEPQSGHELATEVDPERVYQAMIEAVVCEEVTDKRRLNHRSPTTILCINSVNHHSLLPVAFNCRIEAYY